MNDNETYLDDTVVRDDQDSLEEILGLEDKMTVTYQEDINRKNKESKSRILLESSEEFLNDGSS
jgi:hypothetical protein